MLLGYSVILFKICNMACNYNKYKENSVILQVIGIINKNLRNKSGSLHPQIFLWAFNP